MNYYPLCFYLPRLFTKASISSIFGLHPHFVSIRVYIRSISLELVLLVKWVDIYLFDFKSQQCYTNILLHFNFGVNASSILEDIWFNRKKVWLQHQTKQIQSKRLYFQINWCQLWPKCTIRYTQQHWENVILSEKSAFIIFQTIQKHESLSSC